MGNRSIADGSSVLRRRWVGGVNLPTGVGFRINATEPFGELILDGDLLELRLRVLSRLTRAETLRARPADLEVVFAIRSRFRFRGVGFSRLDGHEYYFKTSRIDEVLGALQVAGFPVSMSNQPASKIWRREP